MKCIWRSVKGRLAGGLLGCGLMSASLSAGAQGTALQSVQPSDAGDGVSDRAGGLPRYAKRPARFAEVTLIPVQTASADGDDRFGGGGRRGSARTDLDGNYVVTNLPAGAYYATAAATGYVSTMGAIAARASASADVATLVAQLPQVQVSGSGTTTANLSLERGAVIAGRVMWDDGSAAAGVQVSGYAEHHEHEPDECSPWDRLGSGSLGSRAAGMGALHRPTTVGRFRLTGLAPGDYVVRATFAAPAPVRARLLVCRFALAEALVDRVAGGRWRSRSMRRAKCGRQMRR